MCLHRWNLDPRVGEPGWSEATLRRLASRLRGAHVAQHLLFAPSRAHMLAMGHAFLRSFGCGDVAFDDLLDAVLSTPFSATREASPYEILEQRWCAELLQRPYHASPLALPFDRGAHPLFMSQ